MAARDLIRILQSQGFGSRKDCKALILSGAVQVAGELCDDPKAVFDTDSLVFSVDDEDWLFREQVYLLLHKPAGYECSHQPQHHDSVFDLLPYPLVYRGVQCVGRLDQDTTGLLLLSDDGAFVHALTHPRRHVPKRYQATVKHSLDEAQLNALRNGVLLRDETEPTRALAAEAADSHTLMLTIAEGKYHQVKRMVAAAGNRVEALHRDALGGLALGTLAEGEWRYLSDEDLTALPYPAQAG